MQSIHCKTYQGAIAAAQIEFPDRELYGPSKPSLEAQVISPVIIFNLGRPAFCGRSGLWRRRSHWLKTKLSTTTMHTWHM